MNESFNIAAYAEKSAASSGVPNRVESKAALRAIANLIKL
jgi:hypothetical protein